MARLQWRFPITRPHAGVPLLISTGVLVWGQDDLRLAIGRAGFWDHRGGTEFTTATNFQQLRRLEAGDETAITEILAFLAVWRDRPHKCRAVIDLTPPRGVRLLQADLDHEAGSSLC